MSDQNLKSLNYNQMQHQQVVIIQPNGQMVNTNNLAILIPTVTINNQVPIVATSNDTNTNPATSYNAYLSLLGLADTFLKASQYRNAIHCLETLLTLKLTEIPINTSFHIFLKTRLNLCRLYLKHTLNTNQYVNAHLEKAIILVQNLNSNDEYKYEATYIIYKIFQKQKELQSQLKLSSGNINNNMVDPAQLASIFSLDLARHILESSSKIFPLWHVRLLFLIGNLLIYDKDYTTAAYYMSLGIEYCSANRISSYTHILFILSKGLIHLLQRNPNDLQTTMQPCASLIEGFQTNNVSQIETLKIFFLILQVTYFLQCGQMKSVKNTLKSLQHYIQSLTSRNDASKSSSNEHELFNQQNSLENFQWLHKEHLGILVYLLTVIQSMQTACFEKGQTYTDKALINIQKLKLKEQTFNRSSFLTNKFHLLFLENQIRCSIAIGNRCQSLKHLGEAFQLCDQDMRLMQMYSSQLHCLVGIYSLSVNLKDVAIAQFNQSLQSTNDTDLWLYNAMSLALCYLSSWTNYPDLNNGQAPNVTKNLFSILDKITPDKIQTQNTALTAFSNFFNSIKYFLNSNYQQAQEALRETILLANSEELSNISAQSFLFMGQVNFLMNQFQESFSMLTNGADLADKMPDMTLKIYGTLLLRDLYKYFKDPREAETNKKFTDLEKQNLLDYNEAIKMPQHALINWNTNTSPKQIILSIQRSHHSVQSSGSPSISVSIPNTNTTSNSPVVQLQSNIVQQHQSPSQPQIQQHHHHQQVQNSPQAILVQQTAVPYQHSPQPNLVRTQQVQHQQFHASPQQVQISQQQRTPTSQQRPQPQVILNSNAQSYPLIQQQQQQFSPVTQRPNNSQQMQQQQQQHHHQIQQPLAGQNINYQYHVQHQSPNIVQPIIIQNQNAQIIQQQFQHQQQQQMLYQQQQHYHQQMHHTQSQPSQHNNLQR